MKQVFILHCSSKLSFNFDVSMIYQPNKYELHLIVNTSSYDLITLNQQDKFYKSVLITDIFTVATLTEYIKSNINPSDEINVITNSEETIPICGQIRRQLNIAPCNYSRFYDKNVMKQLLKNHPYVLTPNYVLFDTYQYNMGGDRYLKALISQLNMPLFCKPTQMYSAIGAAKINNFEELSHWASKISDKCIYEIDEFIEGKMFHVDSLIKRHNILFSLVCPNSKPCFNFNLGEMKGTIVLPEQDPENRTLAQATSSVLKQLGMPSGGVTHMEFIQDNTGKLYFVEVAHRTPGCLIPDMHLAHTGINFTAAHYLLQIDQDYLPIRRCVTYAAWACYPKIPGKLTALHKLPNTLSSSCKLNWLYKVGEIFSTYPTLGRDYIGTVFMVNDNFEELLKEFYEISNLNLTVIT
jgi:hypothetical protein